MRTRCITEALEERCLFTLTQLGPAATPRFSESGYFVLGVKSTVVDDGSYVVAANLRSTSGGTDSLIDVRRYAASGSQVGHTMTLVAGHNGTQFELRDLASDAAGDLVLIYDSYPTSPAARQSYFQRLSHDNTRSAPQPLPDAGGRVAMLADGSFFIGTVHTVIDEVTNSVRIQKYHADGTPDGSIFDAYTGSKRSEYTFVTDLQIVAKPDGSGVIFTAGLLTNGEHAYSENLHYGITSLTGTTYLGDFNDNVRIGAHLVLLNDSRFAIGYSEAPGSSIYNSNQRDGPLLFDSYVQLFDTNGDFTDDPIELASDSRAEQVNLTGLQVNSANSLFATYLTTHGTTRVLYAQQIGDSIYDRSDPIELTRPTSEFVSFMSDDLNFDSNDELTVTYDQGSGVLARFSTGLTAVNGSTLFIDGQGFNDSLRVSSAAGVITVTDHYFDTLIRRFSASAIEQLFITDGDGNNLIENKTNLRSTIISGNGNDTIDGGSNVDSIFGGGGNDLIYGNDGNDTLYGQDGRDSLFGNAGMDRLIGGALADSLTGGSGSDRADRDKLDRLSGVESVA